MKTMLLAILLTLPLVAQTSTAIARLDSMPSNRAHGTVWFVLQPDEQLRVVAHVIGLPANNVSSLHIHQLGSLRAVDLGLLKADHFGVARLDVVLKGPRVSDLMGRPVVLHAADSEISANVAVGKVTEADARAMAEMPTGTAFGTDSK